MEARKQLLLLLEIDEAKRSHANGRKLDSLARGAESPEPCAAPPMPTLAALNPKGVAEAYVRSMKLAEKKKHGVVFGPG